MDDDALMLLLCCSGEDGFDGVMVLSCSNLLTQLVRGA